MKKIYYYAMLFAMAGTLTLGLTACGDDDDDNTPQPEKTPETKALEDQTGSATPASYNAADDSDVSSKSWAEADYRKDEYGDEAMESCDDVIAELTSATDAVLKAKLTAAQESELRLSVAATVNNVIIPTYTKLADAAEQLQAALGNVSASAITQANIDKACAAFKEARAWWEMSEAFLGGAASDFDIDPTIDSWPLNRDLLHSYFTTGAYSEEALEDCSILGFHALEFVLFRDGKNRTVADFQKNDTYKGFTDVPAAEELKYAQAVAKELVNRCYQLQVSWQLKPDQNRLDAVKAAGLKYQTTKGKSFGWNLMYAGDANSTFSSLTDALQQLLNADEGSCAAIADEVGTGKIGHPFEAGYIFYVESPYSYNSIVDFRNNIRSIANVWYGNPKGVNGMAEHSLHKFFTAVAPTVAKDVEESIATAIQKVGGMPYPFVKYVSVLWNKSFEDDPVVEIEE